VERHVRRARAERGQLSDEAAVAPVVEKDLCGVLGRARRVDDAQAVVADRAAVCEGEFDARGDDSFGVGGALNDDEFADGCRRVDGSVAGSDEGDAGAVAAELRVFRDAGRGV
jgi:hypothetical protein